MNLHLHSLKLLCRLSEELIAFAEDVTFIHGTLSLGKSTIARLVDFCLGGDLEQTTAVQRELVGAQLSLRIGEHDVLIERNRGENQLRVTWADVDREPVILLVRAKGDGPPVYGDEIANMSDLLFHLLGYPIIRVRKRTGDEDSPMLRLSFRDLFKFCYLEQEELDSSFFRLSAPILAEKSKDALNFFAGYYSEALSILETQFEQLRNEQRAKREAADRITEFLARFGFASEDQIKAELEAVQQSAREYEEWLASDRRAYASETHFVDDLRDRLRAMSDQLQAEKEVAADLDRHIRDQRELRAELISMKFKTARADRAKTVLEGSGFEHCPNCGQPVSEHRPRAEDVCYLCLQPLGPARDQELSAASIRGDLDARIGDIDASLRRHTAARRRQLDTVEELTAAKARRDDELAELLSTYETNHLARTRDAERKLAELRERARFLERVRAMPDAVATMLEEADAISAQLAKLQRDIREEQNRLSHADENFAEIERNFLEALLATRVPGVAASDRVRINRRSLIPEIWPGGDEKDAYTFYTAGSGGKKTLLTICFALALHRTAALRGMPVPTLLIIDTPLKNITPDINPDIVTAFYQYLYRVAENDLRDHQIVLIDQLLVEPPPGSDLDFTSRLMTENDPNNPPLISYYRGP
jgi:RNA polymerase-binding transcription factor DksA